MALVNQVPPRRLWVVRGPQVGAGERTVVDYAWRLSSHLLPFFAKHRLSEVTVEQVDRYRQRKVAEREAIRAARERGEGNGRRPLSNGLNQQDDHPSRGDP